MTDRTASGSIPLISWIADALGQRLLVLAGRVRVADVHLQAGHLCARTTILVHLVRHDFVLFPRARHEQWHSCGEIDGQDADRRTCFRALHTVPLVAGVAAALVVACTRHVDALGVGMTPVHHVARYWTQARVIMIMLGHWAVSRPKLMTRPRQSVTPIEFKNLRIFA